MVRSSTSTSLDIIPLQGIKPKQFLVIAVSVAQKLGWNIQYVSKAGLTAFTQAGATNSKVKVTIRIESFSAQITSEAANEKNQETPESQRVILDFTSALYHPNHAYSARELVEGYEALKPHLSAAEEDLVGRRFSALEETRKEFLSVFKLRENYFITPMLIAINTIVFVILLFAAKFLPLDSQLLLRWGANARSVTLNGQPWRLLASCFLHWDFLHLFMNMMALYFIGSYLELYVGKMKFLVAYVLMGILASGCSLYWHEHGVSAGASGAIFGLYGVFLAFLTTSLITASERENLLPSALIFIGYSLLMGMRGNIDNAAHIGGLISGVIIGYCLYPVLRSKSRKVNILN